MEEVSLEIVALYRAVHGATPTYIIPSQDKLSVSTLKIQVAKVSGRPRPDTYLFYSASGTLKLVVSANPEQRYAAVASVAALGVKITIEDRHLPTER